MTDAASARTRVRPSALLGRVPAWALVVGVVALSFAVRYALGRRTVAPWIVVDEIIYSELAKSFAATGRFAVREQPVGVNLGVVYPLLISPAYLFDSLPTAYATVKAINALVMSLVAVPTYLLARRVLDELPSALAAVLAVAIPPMLYTGMVMTESAFYPVFVTVALLLVLVLERPTRGRVAALLVAVVVAFFTRVQAVVLVPALATAPLVLAAMRRPVRATLRPFAPLYAALGAAVVAALVLQLVRGSSPRAVFGAYRVVTEADYDAGEILRWLLYHVAELDLFLGVAPLAALGVLVVVARQLDRAEQAFVAAAVTLSFWLVVQVAAFASLPIVARVEERNMFYVAPLFLIALLLWAARGAPRPRSAALVAAAAAALPAALPFADLIGVPAVSDTFGLLPWWTVHEWGVPLDALALVAVAAAAVVAALFLYLPRRFAAVLPVLVLLFFVASTQPVEARIRDASIGALFQGITRPERDWVEREARGRDVAAIWTGRVDRLVVHENEFFSRAVGRVYHLRDPIAGGLPETRLELDRPTGLLLDSGERVSAEYALTDESAYLVGEPVSRDERKGVVVYRVAGPLRVTTAITGLYDDGWSEPTLRYTRYRCRGGRVVVELESDPRLFTRRQTVVARVGGRVAARRVVDPERKARLGVPLRSRGGRCDVAFTINPTAVPAEEQRGSEDPRRLGIHFRRFAYTP